jgi:hypothetical protein
MPSVRRTTGKTGVTARAVAAGVAGRPTPSLHHKSAAAHRQGRGRARSPARRVRALLPPDPQVVRTIGLLWHRLVSAETEFRLARIAERPMAAPVLQPKHRVLAQAQCSLRIFRLSPGVHATAPIFLLLIRRAKSLRAVGDNVASGYLCALSTATGRYCTLNPPRRIPASFSHSIATSTLHSEDTSQEGLLPRAQHHHR